VTFSAVPFWPYCQPYVVKPKRTGPIVLGIIGLICFAFKWWLAVLLLAGAVAWWMTQKNNYVVSLASSSGNQEALSSTDEAFIDRVVNALNDAIAERG